MYTMSGSEAANPGPGPRRHRRFRRLLLRCGLVNAAGSAPERLGLTLCVGLAIGTMPLLWGTSLLCILLAQQFRLNQLALQSVNYLLYPLQLMLLVPYFRLGARLFPGGPHLPQETLAGLLHAPGLAAVKLLGWGLLKALAAWLMTVTPALLLICGGIPALTRWRACRPGARSGACSGQP